MRRLADCAALIDSKFSNYKLLDVGCRTKDLKPLLSGCVSYQGLDMKNAPEVIGCNLEKGIPLPDDSFDVVVALDVVEHLDRAHFMVKDMMRVARKGIVISLPNMYYWTFRLNFLLGKGISGKYTFPPIPPDDRHRWLLSFEESVDFVRGVTGVGHIEVYKVMPQRGRLKLLMPLELWFANRVPNFLAYGSLFFVPL
ncbi:MAG: hypothetical protein CMO98_13945 [Woeseia sp.]|nr:hypothetical protein [Woeseia sp.]